MDHEHAYKLIAFLVCCLVLYPAESRGQTPAGTSAPVGVQEGSLSFGEKVVAGYLEAAEQGDADAQYSLGSLYWTGVHIPRDYGKAVDWYTRAALQGHLNATSMLSVAYRDGLGVPQDLDKSRRLEELVQSATTITRSPEELTKEKNEQRTRRSAAREAEMERAARAARSGFVYKSAGYWTKFTDPRYLRAIFDGDTDTVGSDSNYFRRHFAAFVVVYSDVCRSYLPRTVGVVSFRRTSKTYDNFGGLISNWTYETNRIYVEPRFYDKYKEYVLGAPRSEKDLWNAFVKSFNLSETIARNQILLGIRQDMITLLNSESCNGATVFQFKENFLAIAKGTPTVQKSGQPVPEAAAESVSQRDIAAPTTLSEACMAYREYNPGAQKYCGCIERQYRKALTEQERSRFVADYESFVTEVINNDPGLGHPSFEWRLYTPQNACRN